jgi:hypothetical protein
VPAEPAGEPISAIPDDLPNFEDVVVTDADIQIEQASRTSAEALIDTDPSPDDSLAPSSSASSDEPFDFTFEPSAQTDPLEGIEPLEPIDVDDLAQATVLDPRGASGYDVSSSDLGPAPEFESTPEPLPNTDQPPAATYEPDATVLAPEFKSTPEPLPNTDQPPAVTYEPDATVLAPEFQVDDAAEGDLLEAELIGPDSQHPQPESPHHVEVEIEPEIEPEVMPESEPVVTTPSPDPVVTGESLVVTEPSDPHHSLQVEVAAQAESVLENIEPQLHAQIHDTLEKIAWESFGNLTEEIIKQAVERVEAIAWETIPKLAETLIQEEIRRMKGTPPNDD